MRNKPTHSLRTCILSLLNWVISYEFQKYFFLSRAPATYESIHRPKKKEPLDSAQRFLRYCKMSDRNSRDAWRYIRNCSLYSTFVYIYSTFSRGTPKLGNTDLKKLQYLCDESHVFRICYSGYIYRSYRPRFTTPVWKIILSFLPILCILALS